MILKKLHRPAPLPAPDDGPVTDAGLDDEAVDPCGRLQFGIATDVQPLRKEHYFEVTGQLRPFVCDTLE